VQRRVVARLGLLHLRLGKERADELLRVADVLGHHLGAVDDLGLARSHRASYLAREQRLAAAGRPVEQHAAHRRDAQRPHQGRRVQAGGERPPHNLVHSRVQPADAPPNARGEPRRGARLAAGAVHLPLSRQRLLARLVQQQQVGHLLDSDADAGDDVGVLFARLPRRPSPADAALAAAVPRREARGRRHHRELEEGGRDAGHALEGVAAASREEARLGARLEHALHQLDRGRRLPRDVEAQPAHGKLAEEGDAEEDRPSREGGRRQRAAARQGNHRHLVLGAARRHCAQRARRVQPPRELAAAQPKERLRARGAQLRANPVPVSLLPARVRVCDRPLGGVDDRREQRVVDRRVRGREGGARRESDVSLRLAALAARLCVHGLHEPLPRGSQPGGGWLATLVVARLLIARQIGRLRHGGAAASVPKCRWRDAGHGPSQPRHTAPSQPRRSLGRASRSAGHRLVRQCAEPTLSPPLAQPPEHLAPAAAAPPRLALRAGLCPPREGLARRRLPQRSLDVFVPHLQQALLAVVAAGDGGRLCCAGVPPAEQRLVHVALEAVRRDAAHQPGEVRAGKAAGDAREGADMSWTRHAREARGGARREAAALEELAALDAQDLLPPLRVGAGHLDLHLEPAGPEQRGVDELRAVGQADDEHVVELLDAVHLGEQLVDDRVADARRVAREGAALPREGVDLVEHDHVQRRVVARLGLLHLRLGKERADELLRVADVLGHHLGAVDDLGLARSHRASYLAREQRLAAAGRPVEQHAAHRRDAQLLGQRARVQARGERAADDHRERCVEAAHLLGEAREQLRRVVWHRHACSAARRLPAARRRPLDLHQVGRGHLDGQVRRRRCRRCLAV